MVLFIHLLLTVTDARNVRAVQSNSCTLTLCAVASRLTGTQRRYPLLHMLVTYVQARKKIHRVTKNQRWKIISSDEFT